MNHMCLSRLCRRLGLGAGTTAAKGVKSNDLRMFFGPGGSQPKLIPAAVSEAQFFSFAPS